MRIARSASQYVLLPTSPGEGRKPALHALARRAVFENALLGQSEHGDLAASARVRDQSQTGAAVDASDGPGGNGAAANDDEAGAGASGFSLLAPKLQDHACGPP